MAFKVTARTLLHLGAELISSDAVALYELIKNAFDAGSKTGVEIQVFVRLKDWPGDWLHRLDGLEKTEREAKEIQAKQQGSRKAFVTFKQDVLGALDRSAPKVEILIEKLKNSDNLKTLRTAVETANQITITDTGHGMTKDDLEEVYLTIGTQYRREQKKNIKPNSDSPPILGEKGLGRLSAMRLGQRLHVKTSKKGDQKWSLLDIDWSLFSHDSSQYVEDIAIEPAFGKIKESKQEQGTKITISALNGHWSKAHLEDFAKFEAAKFNNPFDGSSRFNIVLRFNGDIIPIPDFDRMLFKHSHAFVKASFEIVNKVPTLRGQVEYRQEKRERSFCLEGAHLTSPANASMRDLCALGPFKMEAYWFNRRLLQKKDDAGIHIGKIVNTWSGGLMLFRDGFRVLPYGNDNDDWLDLDSKALSSQGYKVNRKQLIGRVEISSLKNPELIDQTNREGLRETPSRDALVTILKYILETQLRQFLNQVDAESKSRIGLSFDLLSERVASEKKSLRQNLKELQKRRSSDPQEQIIFKEIDRTVDALESMMDEAQNLADEFEQGRSQVIHLAGLGLMVEFVVHELQRSTLHALSTLADGRLSGASLSGPTFRNLELQLKTLQKRLRALDPATTSGRNTKENFDLAELVREILEGHASEFKRHDIKFTSVRVLPNAGTFPVKMVKGMVIQILENLIANSVYWLKHQQRIDRHFSAGIKVELDSEERTLSVTDNGPGVPNDIEEDIFKPFFTTKPPGKGKGLGLYISREIAKYHDAELSLSEAHLIHKNRKNTFVLSLEK